MNEETRRRKRYLDKGEPYVVPRTTRYCRKQRQSQRDASADMAASFASPPSADAEPESSPGTSSDSDASVEIPHANSGQSSDDGESSSSDDTENGDSDASDEPLPPFDEAQLLASCFHDLGNETLPGSTTTKASAIIMVMSFLTAYGMTWCALDDQLRLIDALFGSKKNVLPRSKFLFRKIWASKADTTVRHHYYCDVCGALLNLAQDSIQLTCPTCSKASTLTVMRTQGCFFSILDIRQQLMHVICKTRQALYENLEKIKSDAQLQCNTIRDVTTGMLYRGLQASGALQWGDLTLTFNTDGSPLYKSSNSSVWPIQFLINELPISHRFQNCMLAGLWFGPQHPDMTVFMDKFVEAVEEVGNLIWDFNGTTISSRVYGLCCCVDAPARAAVGNHVQFNGYFACPWCLASGESIDGTVRYLDKSPALERTPKGTLRDMDLALNLGTTINGVKGPSPLMNLSNFNIVWGYTVEYMHCVLLGVTRQIAEYWIDSSNTGELYYIGSPSQLSKINERLLSIRPPHSFSRLPRSLRDRCYWKANEWRNWLLFYSLPCTLGILHPRPWRHFCLFVQAMFILLSKEFTPAQLQHAERLLRSFVSRMQGLYGERAMTYNIHQVLHLAKAAENLGPLWAHSAFVFESGNGRLVKSVTAAKGAPLQILERVNMGQQLELLLTMATLPGNIRSLCEGMVGYHSTHNVARVGGVCLFGKPKVPHAMTEEEYTALQLTGVQHIDTVLEHFRFSLAGTVYHSRRYRKAKKSDSSVICTGEDYYVILRILQVSLNNCSQIVLLSRKVVLSESAEELPEHIKPCFLSRIPGLTVVFPSEIAEPCLFISFMSEEQAYLCLLPNMIEGD